MGKQMDQDKLKALAAELAKDIKSEKDLGTLTQQLIKLTVETALNAEMDEHLGYEKHAPQGRGTGNKSQWLFHQAPKRPARRGHHPGASRP